MKEGFYTTWENFDKPERGRVNTQKLNNQNELYSEQKHLCSIAFIL